MPTCCMPTIYSVHVTGPIARWRYRMMYSVGTKYYKNGYFNLVHNRAGRIAISNRYLANYYFSSELAI